MYFHLATSGGIVHMLALLAGMKACKSATSQLRV